MSASPIRRSAPTLDVCNVYFERVYDPTMHVVLVLDGEIDGEALRAATVRLIGSDPYLRSRYTEVDGRPFWEEIPEERWNEGFVLASVDEDHPLTTPPPPLDVRSGPQVRVSLSRRSEGDIVAVTCHHGFCDVSGALTLARRVFAAYRGVMEDPDFSPAPTAPYDRGADHVLALFSEEERALAGEEPFIDRWRFPVERPGRGASRFACRTLAPERLGRIKAFGREHDATVNDVLLGAYFLALLEIRSDPADRGAPRSVLTSADLRRRHPGIHGTGLPVNLSIAYEVTLTMGEEARLADVVDLVAAMTAERKAGTLGLASILFYERIMAGGLPALQAFFDGMVERYLASGLKNPVFANLGIFDPDDYLPIPGKNGTTLDLRDVQYLPCVCWPYGFLTIASTFRGCLTIGTAYEAGPYAPATVERFLEYVDGYLP